MDRKMLLLAIAIVLVVVRWLGLPFLEWRDNELETLAAKRAQLAKAEALIEKRDFYAEGVKHYQGFNAELLPILFEDRESIKLEIQKRVEALLRDFDISIQSIAWQEGDDKDVLSLAINLSAPMQRVAMWQLALTGNEKWMEVAEWRLRRAGRLVGPDSVYVGEVLVRIPLAPEVDSISASEVVE